MTEQCWSDAGSSSGGVCWDRGAAPSWFRPRLRRTRVLYLRLSAGPSSVPNLLPAWFRCRCHRLCSERWSCERESERRSGRCSGHWLRARIARTLHESRLSLFSSSRRESYACACERGSEQCSEHCSQRVSGASIVERCSERWFYDRESERCFEHCLCVHVGAVCLCCVYLLSARLAPRWCSKHLSVDRGSEWIVDV